MEIQVEQRAPRVVVRDILLGFGGVPARHPPTRRLVVQHGLRGASRALGELDDDRLAARRRSQTAEAARHRRRLGQPTDVLERDERKRVGERTLVRVRVRAVIDVLVAERTRELTEGIRREHRAVRVRAEEHRHDAVDEGFPAAAKERVATRGIAGEVRDDERRVETTIRRRIAIVANHDILHTLVGHVVASVAASALVVVVASARPVSRRFSTRSVVVFAAERGAKRGGEALLE